MTLQNNKSEKSEIIFLYFLIDPEKYYNKKINDMLIKNHFVQLISLINCNKIIRCIYKFCVMIDKIFYINLYIKEQNNDFFIYFYDGLLQCSDGTSNGLLKIKGNNISDLNKFNININHYINNNMNIRDKISISPYLEENIQMIIIGNPVMNGMKEISFEDMYDNINILKKSTNNINDDLLDFDLLITKNEFTTINGSFLKQSKQLEVIPVIDVHYFFLLDEYINLVQLQKNKDDNKI